MDSELSQISYGMGEIQAAGYIRLEYNASDALKESQETKNSCWRRRTRQAR